MGLETGCVIGPERQRDANEHPTRLDSSHKPLLAAPAYRLRWRIRAGQDAGCVRMVGMTKTPLIERMQKGGAAKAWIKEVESKDSELERLLALKEEYLNVIDSLARQLEDMDDEAE